MPCQHIFKYVLLKNEILTKDIEFLLTSHHKMEDEERSILQVSFVINKEVTDKNAFFPNNRSIIFLTEAQTRQRIFDFTFSIFTFLHFRFLHFRFLQFRFLHFQFLHF